jgi:hypothetical protein
LAVVAAAALALALTTASATAAPSAYQQVLATYQASGTVPPCRYPAAVLEKALGGVDTYGEQYFADFTQAIQAALASRAAGTCSRSGTSPRPALTTPVAGRGPGPDQVARLPSVTSATSAGVPAPLLALAVLAVLGALGGTASAVARRRRVNR